MIPRLRIAAAVVVLTAPALASCGTNFNAPTDQVYTPAVGVNDRDSSVDVLNALVVSGADGSGTLVAALVNNDLENDDALTGAGGAGEDQPVLVKLESGQVAVEAGALVQLSDTGEVSLTGDQIKPGNFVELQLTFERGEPVTLKAPVVAHDGDYADVPVPE